MHFSKTYEQILECLPQELQENSIQYRQLKKIIHQIVRELFSLGLSPVLLHKLLEGGQDAQFRTSLRSSDDVNASRSSSANGRVSGTTEEAPASPNSCVQGFWPRIVYEFSENSSKIEPRLRIPRETLESLGGLVRHDSAKEGQGEVKNKSLQDDPELEGMDTVESKPLAPPGISLLWTLQKSGSEPRTMMKNDTPSSSYEVVIPLVSDSLFFELLYTALEAISTHLEILEADFMHSLEELSLVIGNSARPTSSSRCSLLGGKFQVLSPLKDNASDIQVKRGNLSKSDLYAWREIFQLYIEAEIFQSMNEQNRGERSPEESERRLQLFANKATQRGLATSDKFKSKQSQQALETFLRLNLFILNIKKFQLANSEATRKILKKHAKRTALRPPGLDSIAVSRIRSPPQLTIIPKVRSFSFSRILAQAISETLLPVIPHLDDYSCLICTSIAFKPIRLNCGHLFCVRCLVKMQKRGKGNCPMCRSPSVLVADRSNVDWALMNFMRDWFPREAKEKLKANEEEASAEQLKALGLDPNASCVVM